MTTYSMEKNRRPKKKMRAKDTHMQTSHRMQRTQKANPLSSEPAGHKFNSTPARHATAEHTNLHFYYCLFIFKTFCCCLHSLRFFSLDIFFLPSILCLRSWLLHLLFVHPVHGCPFAAPTALMPFDEAPAIVYAKWVTIVYGLFAAHGIKGIPYGLWIQLMRCNNVPACCFHLKWAVFDAIVEFHRTQQTKRNNIYLESLFLCRPLQAAGRCYCCCYGSFDFYSYSSRIKTENSKHQLHCIGIDNGRKVFVSLRPRWMGTTTQYSILSPDVTRRSHDDGDLTCDNFSISTFLFDGVEWFIFSGFFVWPISRWTSALCIGDSHRLHQMKVSFF